MKRRFAVSLATLVAAIAFAHAPARASACAIPDGIIARINAGFFTAIQSGNGGFFAPNQMWGAIVDRDNRVCSIVKAGDAWPGSRAIALAKAATANDFSNQKLALSTANLYGLVQPGGSLFGLSGSNPFNATFDDPRFNPGGIVPGGIITFGGGVPLYLNGTVIGGFGVSGDTSCADHAVAYISRALAIRDRALTPPPSNDNIQYASGNLANTTEHPHCTAHDQRPPN